MIENCPRIFAVVVTWRGLRWYDRCLGSLRCDGIHPIVVDNASGDGSVEYIREHFPEAVVIPQEENLGFAKANNIGIRYAIDHGADYVLLLNQDAWLENGTAAELLRLFDNRPDAGIASPMHLNAEGAALDFKFSTDMTGDFVSDAYIGSLKPCYDMPCVPAAVWLMSRRCLEVVGGFDTNLFVHYGEDGDYCNRLRYHGFKLYVCTAARAFHDREFRRGSESEYQNRVFSQKETARRSEFANLNIPLDIDDLIRKNRLSVRKARMKLDFAKIARCKKEIEFLERIKVSRETNAVPGPHWL